MPDPASRPLPSLVIAHQAVAARRRLGLWMLGAGVAALAAQSLLEWLLPYDTLALQQLRTLLHEPALAARTLALAWAALTLAALAVLAQLGNAAAMPRIAVAVVAGLLLGSARVAAGGAAPALALLLLAGVATLGWQSWRDGGLGVLLATAFAIAAWDSAASEYATLWPFCVLLAGLFVWIEQRHVQASDRRLLAALTDRERLIDDLDARGRELQRLQAARKQMLAAISHDLRQPLQAVRLYADALRAHCRADDAAALLQHQARAAADAVAMLDQFGEFSAIEQGSVRVRDETFDAREVLRDVAASLRATHPQVRIRDHGRAAWLRSDRTLFARIVQNLAGNAVRYTEAARGGEARVVLALRRRGGTCAVEVIDNGPGIPADKLEAIFEPYVQLDEVRPASGGRGLGLAIVRGLVRSLGLALDVRSRPGRGSRFTVTVPAALAAAAPADAPAARARDTEATLSTRMFALLDDEDAPRLALAAALRGAGAHVVEAPTLAALCERLDDELRFPDALLFDFELRSSDDGIAAVRRLREQWQTEVPALLITGRRDAIAARSLPPRTALLAKPAGLADVAAALQPLLEGSGQAAPS